MPSQLTILSSILWGPLELIEWTHLCTFLLGHSQSPHKSFSVCLADLGAKGSRVPSEVPGFSTRHHFLLRNLKLKPNDS